MQGKLDAFLKSPCTGDWVLSIVSGITLYSSGSLRRPLTESLSIVRSKEDIVTQFSRPRESVSICRAVTVQYLTVKNSLSDKPNEDAVFADLENNVFAVADGVSRLRNAEGIYQDPSPASEAAKLLVEEVIRYVTNGKSETSPATVAEFEKALQYANSMIGRFNEVHIPNPDFGINDYAGAVGIVGSVSGDTFRFAYIGDCVGILVRAGALTYLTKNQTEQIEAYIRANKDTPNLEKTIRREIRNNLNHTLSWGALTGEDKAHSFIKSGEISLSAGDRVILCSDGLLGVFSQYSPLIANGTAEQIVNAMLELETNGNYRSDDKTIVLIDIG